MKQLRQILYSFLLIGFFYDSASTQIKPLVNAQVDYNKEDVRQILLLYINYLNSRPDSTYNNLNWNSEELKIANAYTSPRPADRFYFSNYWYGKAISKWKYTILSVDKVNDAVYKIRTLINNDSADRYWNGKLYDPLFITVYYATKESDSWKLENTMSEETKHWSHYSTKYVNYIYPDNYSFNKMLANKADSFCNALIDTFGIANPQPFDYYICNGVEQMGRLYNMEYWGSPVYGYTDFAARQIISARATEYHIHEFVHMLLPKTKNALVAEGIATFFAGPGDKTFEAALKEMSVEICKNDTVTFSDIYGRKYIHMYDSKPFYILGAIVCKLVYEKKGIAGLKKLMDCPGNKEEELFKTIFDITGTDRKDFEKKVMQYIKTYSK